MNAPWIGSDYGGWNTPDIGGSLVYSFGIGHDYTWDAEVSEAGTTVHMFDPTPDSIAFIAEHDIATHGLTFHPWGIGTMDAPMSMYHHVVQEYDTRSVVPGGTWKESPECIVPVYTLRTIVEMLGTGNPDVVKLCLGGDYEYWVVNWMLDNKFAPRVLIVLALHFGQAHTEKLLERLGRHGYEMLTDLTNPARWTLVCKS